MDATGTFYVIRKSLPTPNMSPIFEAFACIPIPESKDTKCLVYFFSDFTYGGRSLILNGWVQEKIKVCRMGLLAGFRETEIYEDEINLEEKTKEAQMNNVDDVKEEEHMT